MENPRALGMFGQFVYRPYACCAGDDGRIWAVGAAGWGTAGGGVAWLNPSTGQSGSSHLPDTPLGVLPLPGKRLLVCSGSQIRWWDAASDRLTAVASWPTGVASGYAILNSSPPRVLCVGGKKGAVLTLGDPGQVRLDRQFEAPLSCEDLRPWRDGKFVVGGPGGFATLDPRTGTWHHFTDAPLGHRWAFAVLGDTVYYHSGPHLMAVDVPP